MTDMVTAELWAQVVPVWWKWNPPRLRSVRVDKITQKRPPNPEPGCILIKLKLTVPEAAFIAYTEAEVVVPEGIFTAVPPVVVEAVPAEPAP